MTTRYHNDGHDTDEQAMINRMFANPGSNSALRAAGRGNPRNRTCPTCGRKNVLTPADVALGYQCNACADRDEGAGLGSYET